MALWQGKSQRSKTGRRIRYAQGKRRTEIGRETHLTSIGPTTIKKNRIRGNKHKFSAKTVDVAHVVDPETNKIQKTDIKTVIDNPANINYIRRNIITKGAIIDTPLGHAKVTSRPGQVGMFNAILIKKQQ